MSLLPQPYIACTSPTLQTYSQASLTFHCNQFHHNDLTGTNDIHFSFGLQNQAVNIVEAHPRAANQRHAHSRAADFGSAALWSMLRRWVQHHIGHNRIVPSEASCRRYPGTECSCLFWHLG